MVRTRFIYRELIAELLFPTAKAKSKGNYEQAERVLQETAGYRESTKFKDEVAAIVKGS